MILNVFVTYKTVKKFYNVSDLICYSDGSIAFNQKQENGTDKNTRLERESFEFFSIGNI